MYPTIEDSRLIHFGASAHCTEASEYTRSIGNWSALKIRIIVYVVAPHNHRNQPLVTLRTRHILCRKYTAGDDGCDS